LVSVIVPARNEEASLGACLESLVSQAGVDKELIVVDDGSTDQTREIAESFARVRVIEPGPLPEGWTGKNNAVVAGAKIARGEWLLFTDADTVHLPGSLRRSLEEARAKKVSLISYSPQQEAHGFWQSAVMVVIFAELASTYSMVQINSSASSAAAANGQYILIRKDAYEAVGGHRAVATNILEDVALAANVKASGRKIFFRFGAGMVRTHMYRNFAQLREGWTKNLALLFPSPIRLATLRLLEFLLIAATPLVAAFEIADGHRYAGLGLVLVFVSLFAIFMMRIRRAHFPVSANAVALFGLPIFAYLLWRSRLSHKQGNVQWKGRTYASGGNLFIRGRTIHLFRLSGTTRPGSTSQP
jgi:cellulose synthase/poly-beta-1,6-N-acetylglucosamine synthase-like glycosyltransferase